MFDPKIVLDIPGIVWIFGGSCTGIGAIVGAVVKVKASNHNRVVYIPKEEAYEKLQNQKVCEANHKLEKERDKALTDKIGSLEKTINTRFDDFSKRLNGNK